MRVALYHELPPGGARRAASELLARSSARHDYEVFEVVADVDEGGTAIRWDGPRHTIALPLRTTGRTRTIEALSRLRRAHRVMAARINGGRFDVVLAHPSQFTQAPAVLSRLRLPSVYLMQEPRRRDSEPSYRPRHKGVRELATRVYDRYVSIIDRRAASAATAVVCNSSFSAANIVRHYGITPVPCPLGVDDGRFVIGERATEAYVAWVGALDPVKEPALAVETIASIPPDRRPALHLAYERELPGMRSELEQLARDGGVRLILLPRITDAELVALYQGARATLCVARSEPFGLTALESMACGRPVVAVRQGGFCETVVDGVTGVLAPSTASELGAALDRVVTGETAFDPADVRAETLARFSWDAAAACLDAVLERVAAT